MYLPLLVFLLAISSLLVGQTSSQLTANVAVESVRITNDSIVSSELLQQLREEITKRQYGEEAEIAERARYEMQKEGYFKAEVTTSDLQALNAAPGQGIIAVTLRITEGRQYRLDHISFAGNRVFATPLLRQAFAIEHDDVFDTEKIQRGLDELRKLYASQGYINFVPVPNTYPNDQTGTVTLRVDIDEGKRFRIGNLLLSNGIQPWPDNATEKLTNIFRHYAGGSDIEGLIEQLETATLAMFPGIASGRGLVQVRQNVESDTVTVRVVRPATP